MKIFKELIGINSVSGNEVLVQKYILDQITSYGFTPYLVKGNVVVRLKGVDKNKCLIFNSHVDTVSPGELNLWKSNPFVFVEENGKIYGLGASDNKSSVATLLKLINGYSIHKPSCDIILMFTICEEIDGHGTNDAVNYLKAKFLRSYKEVSAIVCEPTGNSFVGLAHKGNLFVKIYTLGKSGHGSTPVDNSKHSVLKMFDVILKMDKLGKLWKKKYKNKILGSPTIGLATSITAGSDKVPNKFPDSCSATFDIRTIPEMHDHAYRDVKNLIGKDGKVGLLYPPVQFGFTEIDAKITKVFGKVTNSKIVAFPGSTDMPFFTQIGIPTVIFGPGEIGQMHKPNEYCITKKIQKCVDIFKGVVNLYSSI